MRSVYLREHGLHVGGFFFISFRTKWIYTCETRMPPVGTKSNY